MIKCSDKSSLEVNGLMSALSSRFYLIIAWRSQQQELQIPNLEQNVMCTYMPLLLIQGLAHEIALSLIETLLRGLICCVKLSVKTRHHRSEKRDNLIVPSMQYFNWLSNLEKNKQETCRCLETLQQHNNQLRQESVH